MRYNINLKKICALGAAMIVTVGCLSGCGGNTATQPTATSATDNSLGDAYPEKYSNYLESFGNEVGEFVNGGAMDEILNGVGSLNSSNYNAWKTKYEDALEKTQRWYSEVDAAAMFCPTDKKDAHTALVQTVGTIYKIMEGLKTRVEAADSGDFSQLTSMSDKYTQADTIAHQMWEKAISDVK